MTRNSTATAAQPIRVAVIEDDPGTRRGIEAIIASDPGVTCAGAFGSVAEAAAGIPEAKPRVVLVDVNLPDGTGIDCVRSLAPEMPETEFVMLTVYHDTRLLFEALSAGAHGYLIKPVRVDALLAAIRDVIGGGAPMSSMVARRIVQSFAELPAAAAESGEEEPVDLAPRERQVLELLSAGAKYRAIADKLGLSYSTVMTYVRRIYKKLHVKSRHFAVERFRRMR